MTVDNEQLLYELGRASLLARRARHENAVQHRRNHHGHHGPHGAHPQPMPYRMDAEGEGAVVAVEEQDERSFAEQRFEGHRQGCCHGHHHDHHGHHGEGHGCHGHEGHHGEGHGCHGHGGSHGKGCCHGHGKRRVLAMLAVKEGMSQKDLAFLLGIRPQSMSETLGKLEEQGFVERRPDESDKRVTKVYLTEKGREHAEHCAEAHQAMAADVFSVLSEEEKDQLMAILEKLSDALEQRERPRDDRKQAHMHTV